MKQTEIGRGMQNRIGKSGIGIRLRRLDVNVPARVEYGETHDDQGRSLLYLRQVHCGTDAIGGRTGRAFLAAFLGMAATVIQPAREH